MTGKTSVSRARAPETAVDIALTKGALGFKSVTPIVGANTEVYVKSGGGKFYHNKNQVVVVRKMGRGGPAITSKPARALKACGGKRGAEFKSCVRAALIHAPAAFTIEGYAGENVSAAHRPKPAHAELAGKLE